VNLFNLDDKTRIRLLKIIALGGMVGTWTNLYFLYKTTKGLEEMVGKHKVNARKMRVAAKVIDRLMKDADPALIQEIVKDFEFDWIVSEIDPIDPDDIQKGGK
jgi:hypothetical protein